jgi:hypothetical protein
MLKAKLLITKTIQLFLEEPRHDLLLLHGKGQVQDMTEAQSPSQGSFLE